MKKRYISLLVAIPIIFVVFAQVAIQDNAFAAQYKTRMMVETADQLPVQAGWKLKKETIKPFEVFLCTDSVEMAPQCGQMTRVWEVDESAELPMNAYDDIFRSETEWVLDLTDSTFLACVTPPEDYLIIPTATKMYPQSNCEWKGSSKTGDYEINIKLDNRKDDGDPVTVTLTMDKPKTR